MTLALAHALHVLAAVIWVGGMFFAYMALRPVAASLFDPPQRLPLWVHVFGKFFPFVWVAIIILPASGYWMSYKLFGGFFGGPLYVDLMNGIGTLMILIFLHLFFAPYQRLKRAVTAQNWPEGGKQLTQIRRIIGTNLLLGLSVVLIASGGRYVLT